MRLVQRPIAAVAAFVLPALALAAAPRTAAAQDYAVKFERPSKVGETYKQTATSSGRNQRSVTVGANPAQEQTEDIKVTLVGNVTVLAVTDKGQISKLKCKVEKFEVTEGNGQPQQPVAAGQTLAVSRDGKKKVVTLEGGGALPEGVDKLVEQVLSVPDPAEPDEDAMFGTAERKKVGDAWDANAAAMHAGLAGEGLPIAKDGVSGRTKLVEVRKEGGVEVAVFETEVTGKGEKGAPHPELPPGVKIEELKIQAKNRKVQPTDVAAVAAEQQVLEVTMSMTMAGNLPDGNAIKVVIKGNRTTESKVEPTK